MTRRNATELAALKQLRSRVCMEGARIRFTAEQITKIAASAESLGLATHHTPEVIEATRLYRETWILPIIDALIAGDTRRLRELL